MPISLHLLARTILVVLAPFTLLSQEYRIIDPNKNADQHQITESELKQILKLQFSKLVTANTFANIGGYAKISTGTDLLKVGATFVSGDKGLFAANVSAGAVNDVAGLYTNGKLSPKTKFDVAYHHLLDGRNAPTIGVSTLTLTDLENKRAQLYGKYQEDSLKISTKQALSQALIDLTGEQLKLSRLLIERALLGNSVDDATNWAEKHSNAKRSSTDYEILKAQDRIEEIRYNIKVMEKPGFFETEEIHTRQSYFAARAAIDKQILQLPASTLKLLWLSAGIGVEADRFTLFTPADTSSGRFVSTFSSGRQLNLAISHYYHTASNKDIYVSAGIKYRRGNNAASLTSLTVRETNPIAGDSTSVYYTDRPVLMGKYEEEVDEFIAYIDFYRFFNLFGTTDNAYHIYPIFLARDQIEPRVSVTLGFLHPFRKLDSAESIANLEIFARFEDVLDTSSSSNGVSGGITLGVSAAFPITFFNN